MENFTICQNEVVEFLSTYDTEKSNQLVNSSTLTDPLPNQENKMTETENKCDVLTQTEIISTQFAKVDEKNLAAWLKKIIPLMEKELLEGVTPIPDSFVNTTNSILNIKPYQKISNISTPIVEQLLHGTATWLSVSVDNTPILVIASSYNHSTWCDHINQKISIYKPQRKQNQGYINFIEIKSINVKTCMNILSTNKFNKDLFAGGCISGDLYIWEYKTDKKSSEIIELHYEASEKGKIIGIIWIQENELLSCHDDGTIFNYKISDKVIKEKSFQLKSCYPTTISSISSYEFVVGCNDGKLNFCSTLHLIPTIKKGYYNPVFSEINYHKFAINVLLQTKLEENDVIVSCDLSGEICFWNTNKNEETPTMIMKMPLPFKSCITFSNNGKNIFSPTLNGGLEVFNLKTSTVSIVEGSLKGKGGMIKVSENGSWIITGIYGGQFQIFYIGN